MKAYQVLYWAKDHIAWISIPNNAYKIFFQINFKYILPSDTYFIRCFKATGVEFTTTYSLSLIEIKQASKRKVHIIKFLSNFKFLSFYKDEGEETQGYLLSACSFCQGRTRRSRPPHTSFPPSHTGPPSASPTMPQPLNSKDQSLFRQVVRHFEMKQYKKGASLPPQVYCCLTTLLFNRHQDGRTGSSQEPYPWRHPSDEGSQHEPDWAIGGGLCARQGGSSK